MKRVRLAAVTTSRADYGLLYPLIKAIKKEDCFEFCLTATGSHLSFQHGSTISEIMRDNSGDLSVVDLQQKGDAEADLCSAVACGIGGFSKLFKEKPPDAVILLGDRYELWSVAIPAAIHKIPIIHIHGGELTQGVIDDGIRHSLTKMASIHFPCTEVYARRIIQMGENPQRVHVVGALGIDNIHQIQLFEQKELSEHLGVDFGKKNIALMTFHPITLADHNASTVQVRHVLEALAETELFVIITMPNTDTGSNGVYKEKLAFARGYPEKFIMIKNMGQRGYLSTMKHSKLMIGNSSSGIIESASFQIPVVNVGDRQEGRLKPDNVIDTECTKVAIRSAIEKALSKDFVHSLIDLRNPYGDGNAAARLVNILKTIDFSEKEKLLKKAFVDIQFNFK